MSKSIILSFQFSALLSLMDFSSLTSMLTLTLTHTHFGLFFFRCSYDYLEIIDSHPSDYLYNANRNSNNNNNNNDNSSAAHPKDINDVTVNHVDSMRHHNESNTSKNVDIFENFLNIYKSHHSYLIQTPEMGANFDKSLNGNAPRRICGDWNSKVKLLRYRSSGPILGLHFSSDYSHHFGGYKAKVVIKNGNYQMEW